MEDNVSIKSSDSVTTSGEYEIVPDTVDCAASKPATSPTLNIANNGDFTELEKNLTEVIHELDDTTITSTNQKHHNLMEQVAGICCFFFKYFNIFLILRVTNVKKLICNCKTVEILSILQGFKYLFRLKILISTTYYVFVLKIFLEMSFICNLKSK